MYLYDEEQYTIDNQYEINYEIVEANICVYKINIVSTRTTNGIMSFTSNEMEGFCHLTDLKNHIKDGNIISSINIMDKSFHIKLVDDNFFTTIKKNFHLIDAIERTDKYQNQPYTAYTENKKLKVIFFSHSLNLIKNVDGILIPTTIKFDYYTSNISNKHYHLDNVIEILKNRNDITFRHSDKILGKLSSFEAIHGCSDIVEFSWYLDDVEIFIDVMETNYNNWVKYCLEEILGLSVAKKSNIEVLEIEEKFNNTEGNY